MTPDPENAEGAAKCLKCGKESRQVYADVRRYCPTCAIVLPTPATPGDGWIEHDGKGRPAGPDEPLEVQKRDGGIIISNISGNRQWHWLNNSNDVVRYRRLAAQPAGEAPNLEIPEPPCDPPDWEMEREQYLTELAYLRLGKNQAIAERDEARARIAGLEVALRSAFPILEDECDGNCAAVGGRCCNCGCEQKKWETVEGLKTLLTNPSLPHTVPSQ
jgi:hypothetical protein